MAEIIRIGMDTSKSLFVLHGVDASEQPVLRKKLRRRQVLEFFAQLPRTCVGMEACGAAHYWGREVEALGHQVKLLPPQRVKPYLPRNKNDTRDAEAISEAMSRPHMHFVPVKSVEQQAALMLVTVRDQMTCRRTQLSNMIRGHAAEFGLVAARGHAHIGPLLARIAADASIPPFARELFAMLGEEYAQVARKERALERRVIAWHRHNELSRRLAEIPSVGPITAATAVMKVTDPHAFRRARDFAAWIGLTPQDHSTAGKQRLGVITRAGDEELRRLLVNGAMSVVKQAQKHPERASRWLRELLMRKPPKLVAVALANKTARIMWKLMVSGERYRAKPQPNRNERSSPRARSVAPCSRRQGRCAPPAAVACGQP